MYLFRLSTWPNTAVTIMTCRRTASAAGEAIEEASIDASRDGGTSMAIFIVMLAVLIAAFVQVARGLTSLYGQLIKVFAAVTSVLLSLVLIAGVSVALLIRR
jgi:hypothetical protein